MSESDPRHPVTESEPYTALAAGYDLVMEHVDYDEWADLVHDLLSTWSPGARTVLELGCGTGSLSLSLQPLGEYEYLGTDRVAEMLSVARAKAELEGVEVAFAEADFTDFRLERPVDAVLLLFDGINYLLAPEEIERLFDCVARALRPGGVFVFDLSTPANSVNNAEYFEDEGDEEGFRYRRTSSFDEATSIHTTTFDIEVDGVRSHEVHRQRAYTMDEIRPIVEASGLEVLETLDGFTREPAGPDTERVHWVVRRASPDSLPSGATRPAVP